MRRERETWLFISDRPRRGGRDRCANGQRRLSRGGRERASRSDRRASLPMHAGRTPRFESERIFEPRSWRPTRWRSLSSWRRSGSGAPSG